MASTTTVQYVLDAQTFIVFKQLADSSGGITLLPPTKNTSYLLTAWHTIPDASARHIGMAWKSECTLYYNTTGGFSVLGANSQSMLNWGADIAGADGVSIAVDRATHKLKIVYSARLRDILATHEISTANATTVLRIVGESSDALVSRAQSGGSLNSTVQYPVTVVKQTNPDKIVLRGIALPNDGDGTALPRIEVVELVFATVRPVEPALTATVHCTVAVYYAADGTITLGAPYVHGTFADSVDAGAIIARTAPVSGVPNLFVTLPVRDPAMLQSDAYATASASIWGRV